LPLELKVGYLVENFGRNWLAGLASGLSTSDRELTRLTLLLELNSGSDRRFVGAYIPRLGPSEYFHLVPILFLKQKDPAPNAPEEKLSVRCSAWCDQFAVEDHDLAPVTNKDARLAYAVQAMTPNTAYLCDPPRNTGSYESAVKFAQRYRHKPPNPDNYCRYGLTFTELKPTAEGYEVRARLEQYDAEDKTKIVTSTVYAGTIRGSQPRPPRDKNAVWLGGEKPLPDLVCEMEGGGKKIHMELSDTVDDGIKCDVKGRPLEGRSFVLAEEQRRKDKSFAEFKAFNAASIKARTLANQGRKEEAKQVLNDYLATSPVKKYETAAQKALQELDKSAH
jgi:hypothetical protein